MALLSRASGPWFVLMTCTVGMNGRSQLQLLTVAHLPFRVFC